MDKYVLAFNDIDKSTLALAGGKGANLGELHRIRRVRVPEGFCVTTRAFNKIIREAKGTDQLFQQLSHLAANDRAGISQVARQIRASFEETNIPAEMEQEITNAIQLLGITNTFAIRSSATAEDLPTASFAGQQDSYLNISGMQEILQHIRKCWASLFTDRAIAYRIQNNVDHTKVQLAVIVQKMIRPHAAGVLFTADPVTSNRKIVSIDASFGLGEALVAGIVNPDIYKVRNGNILDKKIAHKNVAIQPATGGGTSSQPVKTEEQNMPALNDEQIRELEQIGRKIEAHFGSPQDIEWCLAGNCFYIVQSRPITTLFPVPSLPGQENDIENRVYISVGHQQMMTDPMKPLGLSFFLQTTRAPMRIAAGRLFVDISRQLSSLATRQAMLNTFEKSEPLIKDAIAKIIERGDFITTVSEESAAPASAQHPSVFTPPPPIAGDPQLVAGLIKKWENALEECKQAIKIKSGTALLDFIKSDIQESQKLLFDPQTFSVLMSGINASAWLNEKMLEWLGEKNAADIIAQSVENNITSEMGLALLDVADTIRMYPEIVQYLEGETHDNFLEELGNFKGGDTVRAVIDAYLNKYGMRCTGEIDITRPRWVENPSTLLPLILSNIKTFAAGESNRKFSQGRQQSLEKEKDLLEKLKSLPDGEAKVKETKEKIDTIRYFAGYREYPKYGHINRLFVYRQALLKEAGNLVKSSLIESKEDIYYLYFDELYELMSGRSPAPSVIHKRKEEYRHYEKLTPPRVITSDGEIITGSYKRDHLPEGAIPGLAVSPGIAEGRARILFSIENAQLEEGDILVTRFTDPGWTPMFVSVKGLITEVGGLMTHGAVIAREYGLPAVVGVENATQLIKDGQRIRVNGTEGYVELL
jgi:rifampicin phosphotransferase